MTLLLNSLDTYRKIFSIAHVYLIVETYANHHHIIGHSHPYRFCGTLFLYERRKSKLQISPHYVQKTENAY